MDGQCYKIYLLLISFGLETHLNLIEKLTKTVMNIVTYFLGVDAQYPEKSHEINWEE